MRRAVHVAQPREGREREGHMIVTACPKAGTEPERSRGCGDAARHTTRERRPTQARSARARTGLGGSETTTTNHLPNSYPGCTEYGLPMAMSCRMFENSRFCCLFTCQLGSLDPLQFKAGQNMIYCTWRALRPSLAEPDIFGASKWLD
eukprot:7386767-Prymnesium_polylepis.1